MPVEWVTPTNGGWYTLHSLDLAHSHFDNFHGVYIIFKDTETVDVGIGEIRRRLSAHRKQFENRNDYNILKVIWGRVPTDSQGGVENYLRQQLNPTAGQRFSDDPPITVNLPW